MKNLELIAIVASIVLLGAYVLYGLIRAQQTQRRKQSRVKRRESIRTWLTLKSQILTVFVFVFVFVNSVNCEIVNKNHVELNRNSML